MIQFNLLPDVKLEFVKAQRVKHAVISGSVIAAGAALLVFLLLFVAVHVVQRKVINDQTADIKTYNQELQSTTDIDKILTIQSQLGTLTGLHAAKPAASRTFNLIQQLTPPDVSLTDTTVDYAASTISISGVASRLDLVNTMVDTIKYTTYKTGGVSAEKAFSDVVMAEYNVNTKNTTFKITASFDPVIYDNADAVTFTVPAGISTPSVTGQPASLFTKPANGTAR